MKKNGKMTYTRIIVLGFFLLIVFGAVLLSLPISAKDGRATAFFDALFTSTSATCVTGLVVFDTYTHWSLFGQIIILLLIQIGGIGFMTIITMFSIFLRRKISLHERRLLMQSAGTMRISGVVQLIKRIFTGTLIFEGVGAVLLALRFCPKMGLWNGIYNAIFHSISAFCNAGFDIMGKYGRFSSLTSFANDYVVNITIMLLIIIGGIGFLVWNDIFHWKLNVKKYELHTKIVLTTTVVLVLVGTFAFYIFEETNVTLAHMPEGEKLLASFFQSVTARTAGFNTVNLAHLTKSGSLIMIFLMFVGGSPGSTAGGIKTTTLAALILSAVASARHSESMTVYNKRLSDNIARQASAVVTIYAIAIFLAVIIISAMEPVATGFTLFEVVSAAGTVGLTQGITTMLSPISRVILIVLMFGGRVGGVTLMLVLAEKREVTPTSRPEEKILIG